MSSLSAKDRVSLCSFTFSDVRRCRTPRTGKNPRFCFYHAQKEARARAAQKLGKDLAYFFSGDYLSACDLSAALARLVPAVVRGDVKPKTAHTVAYLAQTLMQAIHLSKHEYINACGTDAWRDSVRASVNGNRDYLFPPDPEPQQSESPQPQPHPAQRQTQPPQPAPSPHTPMPPTSTEFVQHVVAGLQTGSLPPTPHVRPAPPNPQPVETPVNCHSERSDERPTNGTSPESYREEPAFSASRADHSPLVTHHSPLPQAEGSSPFPPAELPEHLARNPVRTVAASLDPAAPTSTEPHPLPATPSARSVVPSAHPDNPPRTGPLTPQPALNRDPHVIHFDTTTASASTANPFRINTYTPPTTVDSKPLTATLSPLSATLTKNQGGHRAFLVAKKLCSRSRKRLCAFVGAQHAAPQLGNQYSAQESGAPSKLTSAPRWKGNYLAGSAAVNNPYLTLSSPTNN